MYDHITMGFILLALILGFFGSFLFKTFVAFPVIFTIILMVSCANSPTTGMDTTNMIVFSAVLAYFIVSKL